MGAWQDKNGSLAGQKWQLGRTEIGAWQDRNENLAEDYSQNSTFSKVFCHFCLFSATFGWFLPYFLFLDAISISTVGHFVSQSGTIIKL